MVINKIDSIKAEILVTVDFNNPNKYEIPSPTINYNYHINRNSFIKGMVESSKYLAASSTTQVEFRLFVFYPDLYRSNHRLRTSNMAEVPSLLVMTYDFDDYGFNKEKVTFEIPGTLPLM